MSVIPPASVRRVAAGVRVSGGSLQSVVSVQAVTPHDVVDGQL